MASRNLRCQERDSVSRSTMDPPKRLLIPRASAFGNPLWVADPPSADRTLDHTLALTLRRAGN